MGNKKIVNMNGKPIASQASIMEQNKKIVSDMRLLHVGKFYLPGNAIDTMFDDVKSFMKDVVVVEARMIYQIGAIEYTAISELHFDQIDASSNDPVPVYDIQKRVDGIFMAVRS